MSFKTNNRKNEWNVERILKDKIQTGNKHVRGNANTKFWKSSSW